MSEAYFPRVMKMPAKLVQELLGHDHIEPTPGVQICKMQRAMMDSLMRCSGRMCSGFYHYDN